MLLWTATISRRCQAGSKRHWTDFFPPQHTATDAGVFIVKWCRAWITTSGAMDAERKFWFHLSPALLSFLLVLFVLNYLHSEKFLSFFLFLSFWHLIFPLMELLGKWDQSINTWSYNPVNEMNWRAQFQSKMSILASLCLDVNCTCCQGKCDPGHGVTYHAYNDWLMDMTRV